MIKAKSFKRKVAPNVEQHFLAHALKMVRQDGDTPDQTADRLYKIYNDCVSAVVRDPTHPWEEIHHQARYAAQIHSQALSDVQRLSFTLEKEEENVPN